jgi:hypothetical protein
MDLFRKWFGLKSKTERGKISEGNIKSNESNESNERNERNESNERKEIERLVFAYIDRIPVKRYHDRSMNLNSFINIFCNIYKIYPNEQNIKAFIDASMDKNKERRKQISDEFWKTYSYNIVDVENAIIAYKKHPFAGFKIYSHCLKNLDQDMLDDIGEIIRFFNFDMNNAVFNCVIKNISDYPEEHVNVSITNHRGVLVVIKGL